MEEGIYIKFIEIIENVDAVYQRRDGAIDEILDQFIKKIKPLPVEFEPVNMLAYVSSGWAIDRTYGIEPEEVDIEEFEKILNGD